VTVTLPVLDRARVVLFLCAGGEKREVVSRILSGAAPELPAARVRGAERTVWLLDRAAGG
jgi:6-phosphogluconolactonase